KNGLLRRKRRHHVLGIHSAARRCGLVWEREPYASGDPCPFNTEESVRVVLDSSAALGHQDVSDIVLPHGEEAVGIVHNLLFLLLDAWAVEAGARVGGETDD